METTNCKKCKGSGKTRRETCSTCRGSGLVNIVLTNEGGSIVTPAPKKVNQ